VRIIGLQTEGFGGIRHGWRQSKNFDLGRASAPVFHGRCSSDFFLNFGLRENRHRNVCAASPLGEAPSMTRSSERRGLRPSFASIIHCFTMQNT
jgi:hypothetical protein